MGSTTLLSVNVISLIIIAHLPILPTCYNSPIRARPTIASHPYGPRLDETARGILPSCPDYLHFPGHHMHMEGTSKNSADGTWHHWSGHGALRGSRPEVAGYTPVAGAGASSGQRHVWT